MRASRFDPSFGIFLFGGIFFMGGCSNNTPAAGDAKSGDSDKVIKKPAADFETTLKEIAQQYKAWPQVSGRAANWAPTLCAYVRPALQSSSGVEISRSHDADTHGQKLYFLFAKDAQAYRQIGFADTCMSDGNPLAAIRSPVGQVVVKESWHPVEVDSAFVPGRAESPNKNPAPALTSNDYTFSNGKAYRTGGPAGLFVMYKLDPKTPGTDEGWVYGTLSPDGAQVYQAGRIESCMNCHTKTDRDRLFGLPRGRKEQK